jgi:phosphate starvation-inducible protein PhoH
MSISHDPHMLSTRLSEVTTLDTGQATAIISALRHEIALIQGPPGTRKSYVGIQIARVLLNNRDLLGLGPILCV